MNVLFALCFFFLLSFSTGLDISTTVEGLKLSNLVDPSGAKDAVSKDYVDSTLASVLSTLSNQINQLNDRMSALETNVASLNIPPMTFYEATLTFNKNATHHYFVYRNVDQKQVVLSIPKADLGSCVTTDGCCDSTHTLCYGIDHGYGMVAMHVAIPASQFEWMGCGIFSMEDDSPFSNENRVIATEVNRSIFGFTGTESLILMSSVLDANRYTNATTLPALMSPSTRYRFLCF